MDKSVKLAQSTKIKRLFWKSFKGTRNNSRCKLKQFSLNLIHLTIDYLLFKCFIFYLYVNSLYKICIIRVTDKGYPCNITKRKFKLHLQYIIILLANISTI